MRVRRHFVVFDRATGEITHCHSCDRSIVEASFAVLVGGEVERFDHLLDAVADGRSEYVDVATRAIVPRREFALTIEVNRVSGVPSGTRIMNLWDRSEAVMDASGVLELEVDHPELLRLRLRHPHYLTAEIEVECAP